MKPFRTGMTSYKADVGLLKTLGIIQQKKVSSPLWGEGKSKSCFFG